MTGRGQRGGSPGRDHWRGGRDGSAASRPASGEAPSRHGGDVFSTWVEVEELSTQALAPRPRARLPLTGVLAVGALAILLAGGFGLLGGASDGGGGGVVASPLASAVAEGSPAPSGATPPPEPRVTPWAGCSSDPDVPPEPVLEVDGRQFFGDVEVVAGGDDAAIDSIPRFPSGALDDAVEVPMDSITEIWIVGGSCAIAWNLALLDERFAERMLLEAVPNQSLDPAVASQNRFQVFVAPLAGDHLLRAVLVFEGFAVRATWAIHVPALEPPPVRLEYAGGEIPMAVGCDVTQRLVTGWEEPLNPCPRHVSREPATRTEVAPGQILEFSIAGWAARNTSVVCGQLEGRLFVPTPDRPCVGAQNPLYAGVHVTGPETPGPWTIAFNTCGTRIRVNGSGVEELCGTWYANIRVRD